MHLIDRILQTPEFFHQPPVLVDIGASGAIHKKWKRIARYATCIAFDADERDFEVPGSAKTPYGKLLIKRSLVADQIENNRPFYLTVSPHCSSLLPPHTTALADWAYAPIFQVVKQAQLNTVTLENVLTEFNISYIDWYKSDSQGIDLRLFKSLPASIQQQIIVAEFEPGILDAYIGEDKLKDILQYLESDGKFWLADLQIKGTVRIPHHHFEQIVPNRFLQKLLSHTGKIAPGWAEMTWFNNFKKPMPQQKRSLYLGWVCATLQKHHGFAYTLACQGKELFGDTLFDQMQQHSKTRLRLNLFSFRYFTLLYRKMFN